MVASMFNLSFLSHEKSPWRALLLRVTAAIASLFWFSGPAGATIIEGPVVNPANGHSYYLLSQNTWTGAEAEAVSLGGHLATIRNAEESAWITSTFGAPYFYLWIGLNDAAFKGHFVWSSGEPVTYLNWYPGEPNNLNGTEDYVAIYNFDSGFREWNDWPNVNSYSGFPFYGIAEVMNCQVVGVPTFYQAPPVLPTVPCPLTSAQLGNAPWACDSYANTDARIREEGCALTVLAMALRFAGVATIPGTTISLDPGSLNRYMVANQLYDASANVCFNATARTISGRSLKLNFLSGYSPNSNAALDEMLCNGYPVIVAEPDHFILVTGKMGPTYSIIDPGYRSRTTLAAYNNTFSGIRGYIADPPGDISGLDIDADTSAELLLTDASGNRTGYDPGTGNIVEEIPQSVHFVDALKNDQTEAPPTAASHSVMVFQPGSGTYRLELIGIAPGVYTVSVRAYSQDGGIQQPIVFQGISATGSVAAFDISLHVGPGATSSFTRVVSFQDIRADILNALSAGLIDNWGVANSLLAKLNSAEQSSSRGQTGPTSTILSALKSEIKAQSGKHVTKIVAEILLEEINALISGL